MDNNEIAKTKAVDQPDAAEHSLRFEFLQEQAKIQDKIGDQKAMPPLPPPWKPDPICNPPFDPFCKPNPDPFPWDPKPQEKPHKPKRHKH